MVVEPLWQADDYATMLVMRRFYERLGADESCDPAVALRDAQCWLRDVASSGADLDEPAAPVRPRGLLAMLRGERGLARRRQPTIEIDRSRLAHPHAFAAFTLHGNRDHVGSAPDR